MGAAVSETSPYGIVATIPDLLRQQAHRRGDAPAIGAPGRRTATYAQLWSQVEHTTRALRTLGVGPNDAVALVLPDGPELAVAFLGVTATATAAPLNPRYRRDEFRFYLDDLDARALIVAADYHGDALEAARDIPVVRMRASAQDPAGVFRLGEETAGPGGGRLPGPDDVALVLHTSGTTARPKIVPLTHGNLCASAAAVARTLELDTDDVGLQIMPLFHIHGLVAALLAPLVAGGSVVCTPGFHAPSFFDWIRECAPSWYTAVPTMHQAILRRRELERDAIEAWPMRFVRSSSAALPPPVLATLEKTFGVPVIEAYGMTEAAHQMASNPLPPRARKPGSVGPANGPDLCILDDAGVRAADGVEGEVYVRGAGVMQAYRNNPQANAQSFRDGWFATGDLGYLDGDGYLFLTGRKKELINRAGEKIAPREIDEVLLTHPAVAQAVTFAMPDANVGEEVAAAVVLKEGAGAVDQAAIQGYLADRIAAFKVPRHIEFLPDIPKGPTGKIQRIGLARRLGLAPEPAAGAAERTARDATVLADTALAIARIWAEVLKLPEIGPDQHFFHSGGDSITAGLALARMNERFGTRQNIAVFFGEPTPRALAPLFKPAEVAAATPPPAKAVPPEAPVPRDVFARPVSTGPAPVVSISVAATDAGPDPVKGYRVLAGGLAAHGVTHLMALTGTPINDLLPACAAVGVRPIGVRSQMAGAHMAAALNYMAGKLVAAVAMSAGPGITNAACGVYTAKANGWPLLVIGGGRSNGTQDSGEFQDMDSARFYESITKYSALVESVDRLPFHLSRALRAATTGRPGPVYLDVPEGVLYERKAFSEVPPWDPTRPAPVAADAVAIAQAAERLNAAERPIVLIDSDLRWGCDWQALRRLVERLGAPFVTSSMARGFVPQSHPLCADALATRAMREADCALLLGARLDWQFRYGVELPAGIPIIQACLEPTDVGMRRPATVALVAPPNRFVAELLPLIADHTGPRQKWTDELARGRRDVEAAQARDHAAALGVTPDTLAVTLRQSLPADALVIADGSACYGAVQPTHPGHLAARAAHAGPRRRDRHGPAVCDGRAATQPGAPDRGRIRRRGHRAMRDGIRDGRAPRHARGSHRLQQFRPERRGVAPQVLPAGLPRARGEILRRRAIRPDGAGGRCGRHPRDESGRDCPGGETGARERPAGLYQRGHGALHAGAAAHLTGLHTQVGSHASVTTNPRVTR